MAPSCPNLESPEVSSTEMGTTQICIYEINATEAISAEAKATGSDAAQTEASKNDASKVDVPEVDVVGVDAVESSAIQKNDVNPNVAETVSAEKNDEVRSNIKNNDAKSQPSGNTPSTSPYVVGQIVRMHIDEEHTIDATIVKLFEPFTLSCVMVVHVDTLDLRGETLQGEYVLKLYDRRFSQQLRKDEEAVSWTRKLESKYHEFVKSGCASGFFNFCDAKYGEDWDWGELYSEKTKWTKPQLEGFLQYHCLRTYGMEKKVYDLIRDLQGKHVPRIFAHPWLQLSKKSNKYLDCPGILMEYIKGYELTDIAENAPVEDWQYICDEAIQIIQLICIRGVMNKDIQTRSFLIRQGPGMEKSKVCMMDFGLCMFRDEHESVADFRESQAYEGEEGRFGREIECQLRKGYKYLMSSWAWDLLEEFMRE